MPDSGDLRLAGAVVDAITEVTDEAVAAAEKVVDEALESANYATRLDELDKKIEPLIPLPEQVSAVQKTLEEVVTTLDSVKTLTEEAAKTAAEALDKVVTQPVAEVGRTLSEPIANPGGVVDTIADSGKEVVRATETAPRRTHALTKRWFGGR